LKAAKEYSIPNTYANASIVIAENPASLPTLGASLLIPNERDNNEITHKEL